MLAIELTLPILLLVALLLCAFAAGFLLRRSQIKSCKKKIIGLEKEMLNNHAEILELHRERALVMKQLKEPKIPVIPMNSKDKDDNSRQVK